MQPRLLIHTSDVRYTAVDRAERNKKQRLKFSKKSQMKALEVKPQMTLLELANLMDRPIEHVQDCLQELNYAQNRRLRDSSVINNFDVITKIVKLSGFRCKMAAPDEVQIEEQILEVSQQDETRASRAKPSKESLVVRPPVVTIMGHVDHGKTTLLDSLRGSHIVEKEFGGITQHIGAFNCSLASSSSSLKRNITFLDTPGHAAFSMMRSRGARLTDIVVLVIAAEDGIMAQTVESIKHAKSMSCPIIVAINKIDKVNEEQIARVKRQLLEYELIPEEMGGDVQIVPISALKKTNLELLKEVIWAQAEMMELRGDPKGLVEGYIIESSQDVHKGKLATVLIQRGSLQRAAYLVAGLSWCKVKFMYDENSANLAMASLSQAVQVMGWKELPKAGDEVLQVESEHRAKELVHLREKIEDLKYQQSTADLIKKKRDEHTDYYKEKLKERRLKGTRYPVFCYNPRFDTAPAETPMARSDSDSEEATTKTLHVILKADVNGSLEAILDVLETYNLNHVVKMDIVHFEVGQLKKSDLEMAELFNAIIYCFNLPVNKEIELESTSTTSTNTSKKSKIRHFNVIYKLFDDLKSELAVLTPLVEAEEKVGEADVLRVFSYKESHKKQIQVAGGQCKDGQLDKNLYFRLVRDNKVIFDKQKCGSLKHLKTDVSTIKRNVEFGFSFENQEIKVEQGDKLVCYAIKMVNCKLDWDLGF
jgi:translation initiation factor IF-2